MPNCRWGGEINNKDRLQISWGEILLRSLKKKNSLQIFKNNNKFIANIYTDDENLFTFLILFQINKVTKK